MLIRAIATYELYLEQHKAHTVPISSRFDECNLLLLRIGEREKDQSHPFTPTSAKSTQANRSSFSQKVSRLTL